MNFFTLSLLFTLLINLSKQVFFLTDPGQRECIYRTMEANTNFSGQYYLSGQNEEQNVSYIMDERGNVLWKADKKRDGSYNIGITQNGKYYFCIVNQGATQLTVAISFFDEVNQDEHVSIHSLENVNSVSLSVRRKMDIIHNNMRNSAVRRATHYEISSNINSKITFYTAIKILFLILFSGFQILMLTQVFGNVKIVNRVAASDKVSPDRGVSVGGDDTIYL